MQSLTFFRFMSSVLSKNLCDITSHGLIKNKKTNPAKNYPNFFNFLGPTLPGFDLVIRGHII